MIRRAAGALAGLAVVLACAACGTGDGGGTGSVPASEVETELGGIESTLDEIEAELAGG